LGNDQRAAGLVLGLDLHGSIEGWNELELGGSVTHLAPGKSWSVRQTLSILCVNDAEFEIHYSSRDGRDFTQLFGDVNIEDKRAVLSLTHE
jgi:hypothetical protein